MGKRTVDDMQVLKHALAVIAEGSYPGPTAVTEAMGWRHSASAVHESLRRLKAARLLVIPDDAGANRIDYRPDPKYRTEQIERRAREVREDHRNAENTPVDLPPLRTHAPEAPPGVAEDKPIAEVLHRLYWTPARRAWYRRQA